MCAVVSSGHSIADYLDAPFLEGSLRCGGRPEFFGPATRHLDFNGMSLQDSIRHVFGDGLLNHKQRNFQPGWMVTFTSPKDWALVFNAIFPPQAAPIASELVADAAKETLLPYLETAQARLGAAGGKRVPAEGLAFGAVEAWSRRGDLLPHYHAAVANGVRASAPYDQDKKWRTFANARRFHRDQSLLNADFMKRFADSIQIRFGVPLERDGKSFRVVGFPLEQVRAASSGAAEIDRICKEHGWTTKRQRQLVALIHRPEKRDWNFLERWCHWQAETRKAVPNVEKFVGVVQVPALTPNQAAARAARHVLGAIGTLIAERGYFTTRHLREEVYLRTIGEASVSVGDLNKAVGRVSEQPRVFGLSAGPTVDGEKVFTPVGSGHERGAGHARTDRSSEQERGAAGATNTADPSGKDPEEPTFKSSRSAGPSPRGTTPDQDAEWIEGREVLKKVVEAASGVVAATAVTGRWVAQTLSTAFRSDKEIIYLHADMPRQLPSSVGGFLERLNPVRRPRAHFRALARGLLNGRGNLVDRLRYAEFHYRQYRTPRAWIGKNTVLVVTKTSLGDVRELTELDRRAKKAGASVVYCESVKVGQKAAERLASRRYRERGDR